jgi:4-hydroxyphenylpyruvate dioxygenase
MTVANHEDVAVQPHNVLKLKYFDYVEIYVGNPVQAAHYYQTAFGFTPIAYAGLETKVRDKASFVMQQGDIRLVLTGAFDADSPISEHVKLHGDSVKDIAFEVEDATAVYEAAIRHGAKSVLEPTVFEGQKGRVIKATIAAYGDSVHSFVQRNEYEGVFFPGYHRYTSPLQTESTGLIEIDHVAVGIEPGQLDSWVEFYKNILSFHEMHEEMISTEHSAMNSSSRCRPAASRRSTSTWRITTALARSISRFSATTLLRRFAPCRSAVFASSARPAPTTICLRIASARSIRS